MKTAARAVTLSIFYAASLIGVSAITANVTEADSNQLAVCHWYKQQAFKLKTDAAWTRYHDCMRGRL